MDQSEKAGENSQAQQGTETPADATRQSAETPSEEATDTQGESEESTSRGQGNGHSQEEAKPGWDDRMTYIQQLEKRVLEGQRTLAQYIQAYKQIQDEKDDFKRRLEREKVKEIDIQRGQIINDLLELMDNLDRSVHGAEAARNYDALATGIKMVQAQFLQKLEAVGARPIPTVGEVFDPNRHEALHVMAVEDPAQDGIILREFARGFTFADRVVRPSRVQVGKAQ